MSMTGTDSMNTLHCVACQRLFKSLAGLKNHQRACKPIGKSSTTSTTVFPTESQSATQNINDGSFRKEIRDAYNFSVAKRKCRKTIRM